MTKISNTFSIYLLNENYTENNFEKAITNIRKLTQVNANELPTNAKMYYKVSEPSEPDWVDYWGASIRKKNQLLCALVFYPMGKQVFIFSYGYAFVYIREEAVVQDFGIRVSANLIDPNSLRSTDTYEFSSSKRGRIQAPNLRNLNFFDIDTDTTILKSITGKVRESCKENLKKEFNYVTGANNIRISTKTSVKELPSLLKFLLDLYLKEIPADSFADFFEQIKPILDTETKKYDKKLYEDLTKANLKADLDFSLPEMIDFQDYKGFSFSDCRKKTSKKVYENLTRAELFKIWEEKKKRRKKTENLLNDCKVYIYNKNYEIIKNVSLKKCIHYITNSNSTEERCYLHDGIWYKFTKKYIEKIDKMLNTKILSMEKYNLTGRIKDKNNGAESEEKYNKRMVKKNPKNFINLDRDLVFIGRNKVEICDLIMCMNNEAILIHVKIAENSQPLGHLFNQGYVSAELLLNNKTMKDETLKKINGKNNVDERNKKKILSFIKKDKFKVVYAIITKKKKVTDLPFFAKIALVKVWKNLNRLQVKSEVILIEDKS